MMEPFHLYLAKQPEDVGSRGHDFGRLKEIGNRNKAVVFKDLPAHLSVANVETATDPSGETRFTLFKYGTRVMMGSRDPKIGDGYNIRALAKLKAGLTAKQSLTPIPKESFIKFAMADYYGCVKMKVTPANRNLCLPLETTDAAGVLTRTDRTFLECKMVKNSLLGNKLLLDLIVINPHDLVPGDEFLNANVHISSY